jgi:two-component system, NtrC family, nitrogen regulation response regulator NtrX
LYFRLSVIPIKAPPLRERLEDIPALVQHFVAQFSRENNRRPARFSQQSIEALKQARWRGNIRELKNVVERLLIMSDRDVIDGDDVRAVVPTVVRTDASASLGSGSAASPVVTGAATLRAFKEASERAWLVDKLREHGWNISKTAEEIDTPRSNLYKKLEQYGIRQEVDG